MDFLLPLMVCFALGAPIGLAGAALIGHGPEVMSGLFVGYKGLEWPHGVQEEDPPGGWTWRLPAGEPSPAAQSISVRERQPLPPYDPHRRGVQVDPWRAGGPQLVEGSEAIDRSLLLTPIVGRVRTRQRGVGASD
jgi:hypothetical protein